MEHSTTTSTSARLNGFDLIKSVRESATDKIGKLVLFVLATYADEEGECWPSKVTIARQASLSRNCVIETIQRLEREGHLTQTGKIETRETGAHSEVLRLHLVVKSSKKPASGCNRGLHPKEQGVIGGDTQGVIVDYTNSLSKQLNDNGETTDEVFAYWNSKPKLAHIRAATKKRKQAASARLKDKDFRANFREAIDRVAASDFHTGKNDRQWVANIDWFLRDGSFVRVMETLPPAKPAPSAPKRQGLPDGWQQIAKRLNGWEPAVWGELSKEQQTAVLTASNHD